MREIKLRIREKGYLNIKDALYITLSPLEKEVSMRTLNIFPGDVVEQYTGLKDVNGKEIYEGDVVKGDYNYKNYVVKFGHYDLGCNGGEYNNPQYGWYIEDELDNEMFIKEQLEVIGNIYENPELLEKYNG